MIPTKIVDSVQRVASSSSVIGQEFVRRLDAGAKLVVAGEAKKTPGKLLSKGLKPKHRIDLFDTSFYFTNVRQIPELRYFVVYVAPRSSSPYRQKIYARIVYKDLSLAWRCASHLIVEEDGIWVGKGDIADADLDGEIMIVSKEATTDLPIEMQTGIERLLAFGGKPKGGEWPLHAVLRQSPTDRVEPYADFVSPRRKAQANLANLINRGVSIARFKKKNDPRSLAIVEGFEPDFDKGIIESSRSKSRLYGGSLLRTRVLSVNQRIQYYFYAGPKHVWLMPPQALTTELSSYGVRTIDVEADDDLFIPGYEYHHFEETNNGPELYSQIPPGYAGEICPFDDVKADASPWLDEIPLIKRFRETVLKKNR